MARKWGVEAHHKPSTPVWSEQISLLVGGCDHEFGQFFVKVGQTGDFLNENGLFTPAGHDGISKHSIADATEEGDCAWNVNVFDIDFVSV